MVVHGGAWLISTQFGDMRKLQGCPMASSGSPAPWLPAIPYHSPAQLPPTTTTDLGQKADHTNDGTGHPALQALSRFAASATLRLCSNPPPRSGPQDCDRTIELITQSRRSRQASVDEFHRFLLRLQQYPEPHFLALVATLLSVQTRDAVALGAMRTLMRLQGKQLCVQAVVDADMAQIEACISSCNYYKSKAKYIKAVAEVLHSKYDGKMPNTFKELVALPGLHVHLHHMIVVRATPTFATPLWVLVGWG